MKKLVILLSIVYKVKAYLRYLFQRVLDNLRLHISQANADS